MSFLTMALGCLSGTVKVPKAMGQAHDPKLGKETGRNLIDEHRPKTENTEAEIF